MQENNTPNNRRKKSVFGTVRIILIVVFASIAVFSACSIIYSMVEHNKANKVYGPIEGLVDSIINNTDEDGSRESMIVVWTRGSDDVSEPSEITVSEEPTEPVDTPKASEDSTKYPEPTDIPELTDKAEQPTEDEIESQHTQSPETTKDPSVTQSPQSSMFLQMKLLIEQKQKINPDVMGWLYIEMDVYGEKKTISYPILKTDNNEFYLNHDYKKDLLQSGSIFADKDNSNVVSDNKNLILYGHNMFAGTMFHSLSELLTNKSCFDSTKVYIYTTKAIYVYELFSVYYAKATDDYFRTSFKNNTELVNYMYDAQQKSAYHKDIGFYPSDKFITLSTCYGLPGSSGRLAVHGVLTSVLK